jgi:hypothetical protein
MLARSLSSSIGGHRFRHRHKKFPETPRCTPWLSLHQTLPDRVPMGFDELIWAFFQREFFADASAAGVSYFSWLLLSPLPQATIVGSDLATLLLNRLPLTVRFQVSTARFWRKSIA